MEIDLVLPATNSAQNLDLQMLEFYVEGKSDNIEVVEDDELYLPAKHKINCNPISVIEVTEPDTSITFICDSQRPHLCIQFKSLNRFLKFSVLVVGDDDIERKLEMGNKYTVVTIEHDVCKMPLQVRG